MKQPALTTNQAVLLMCMHRGFPELMSTNVAPDKTEQRAFGGTLETDIKRLDACGYVSPVGPRGDWTITVKGRERVERMCAAEPEKEDKTWRPL